MFLSDTVYILYLYNVMVINKYLHLNALRSFQEEKYDLAIKFSSEVIDNYDTEFKWVLGYAHLIRGKSLELS